MEYKLSKEEFVESIAEVKHLNGIDDALNKCYTENGVIGILYHPNGSARIVRLLNLLMNDEQENWTSYFCYKLDFGKKWKPGLVKNKYGKEIPMSTAEELYDFLVSRQ